MPVSRARAIGRSAGALIALAAIAFGVPVILIGVAGWPLPTSMPDLGNTWTRLQQGDVPADSVVKAMAIVVWLIWIQFAWAIAWELAVNARRVAERRPPRAAPFTPAMVSAGIGRLVAMVFSASIVVASLPIPSLADSLPLVAVEQPVPTQAPASLVPQQIHPGTEPCWVVQTGDTLWKVAETALGDGARCAEIIDLNADIRSARDVRAGQHLLLPADADIPSDRQGAPAANAIVASGSTFLEETTIVIEPGDTLWDLSTDRLASANAEPPVAADVVAYVHEVVERNSDVVEDPDLIYPGEVFVMPSIGAAPAPPTPARVPDDEPVLPEMDREADVVAPVGEPVTAQTTPRIESNPTPAPNNEAPYQGDAVPTAKTAVGTSVALNPAEEAVESQSWFASAWTLAAGASTTLLTGLLLLRRRRQRLASLRGVHAAKENPHGEALESSLVRAADVPLLTWARHELSSLFGLPDLGPVSGVPVAVEISEVTGIEMLWSSRNRGAPRPWESADDGWTWRATYDEDIEIPNTDDSTPLPGLVTVGARNGRDLMINLEAFGVLDLVGDPEAILDLARSMIVELSTDEILADTYVHVVGEIFVDLPATGRHRPTDVDTARSLLERTTEEHGELLSEAQVDSTFELRRVAGASGREVATVVVSGDRDSSELRELATANRGVGLIVAGSTSTSGAHIVVQSDGSAELRPMGIKFTAASIPGAAIASLVELLELEVDPEPMTVGNADPAVDKQWTTEDPALEVAGGLALVGASIVDAEDRTADDPPVPPEILVSVFGRPMVADFPELGRMDTNVVVFLATNGGEATDSQLIDAVWNGRMVEQGTVWNRISKVRSIVGPLLPARASGDDTIRLARSARTDLDYFTALVEYADDGSSDEAIGLLSDALDLINGPPFDAPGYEWAHQHQHHSRACGLVESTALRLVDLALDAGALGPARHGVTQALKALPANEPLYRARMRLESAADNPSGVAAAFDELASLLAEMSEDGFEFEPSHRTIRLRSDLLDTSSVRSA